MATPRVFRAMIVDDQHDILTFLSSSSAYSSRTGPVERIDTHGAVIFLAGSRAYKVKRAVRYDYMDFSTLARRRRACQAELAINRRTAPDLYLGVRPVVRRPDGSLRLGGAGVPVEWLVEMRRFDEAGLLDRRARRGDLDETTMLAVADAIVALHQGAGARPDHGGAHGMRWVVDGNIEALRRDGVGCVDAGDVQALDERSRAAIETHERLLERRRRAGLVRQCHGDLHLRNICSVDDAPVLFDAIEFNDELACVDVLYDLAFLLMDLAHRRLPALASVTFNRYLGAMNDWDGLALMPLFLSCRAAVRAKTSLAAARVGGTPAETARLERRARQYLTLAIEFLRPIRPRLVAVGGASGAGKSTLAAALAPELEPFPGAVLLRSDVVRKALCGVSPTQRLAEGAYSAAMNRRVYGRLVEQAERTLRARHPVIVDAVFGHAEQRHALQAVAERTGAAFTGLWLKAPADRLEARLRDRVADASDATVAVLRRQLQQIQAPADWRVMDAADAPDDLRRAAWQAVTRGDDH